MIRAAPWDGLAVWESGAGDTVLWLHGYTMRTAVWETLWRLLPDWRHLGVDLPFHGESRGLRAGEDLHSLADLMVTEAVRSQVRHVVALSFGTVVAIEMAIRHPAAFRSWTLAAPALAGMSHEPAVAHRYEELARLWRRRGPGPHLSDLWMSSPPNIFAGVQARPEISPRVRALVDEHAWTELGTDGIPRLVSHHQRAEELAPLSGSLLLLAGQDDLLTHRACANSLLAACPAAYGEILPGAGHLALIEEPVAAAAILDRHFRGAARWGDEHP